MRTLFDSSKRPGRVVVVESDTDPGDMGEPRDFSADGVFYITVPPPSGWPALDVAAATPVGLDVERLAQAISCWSAPIEGEGDPAFVAWAAQMIRSYLRAPDMERPYPHRAISVTNFVGPDAPVTRLTVMPHVGLSGISEEDWEADGTTVGPLHPCSAVLYASVFQCKKWAIVSLLVIPPNGNEISVPICGSHFTRHRNSHEVVVVAAATHRPALASEPQP